jgi:hypothetical protein
MVDVESKNTPRLLFFAQRFAGHIVAVSFRSMETARSGLAMDIGSSG